MSIVSKDGFLTPDTVADALLPLHMQIDPNGVVRHIGPTLRKISISGDFTGKALFDIFDIRRSQRIPDFLTLMRYRQGAFKFRFLAGEAMALKGFVVPMPDAGAIINLSLGISMRDIVRRHALSAADFAPTDPTVDMLYLIEANSAAWDESRRLTQRLQGAKVAAEEQAYSDTLTGLKNRRAMEHTVNRMIKAGSDFSLMNLDLDFFKQVNDTLGHAAGDHVLQRVADILVSETRSGDMIARIGGDEFVMVLNGCNDPRRLARIARRIIKKLEIPIPFEGHLCQISASIGTTKSSYYDDPTLDVMLADADLALYRSKGQGRARHSLFQPETQDTHSGDERRKQTG